MITLYIKLKLLAHGEVCITGLARASYTASQILLTNKGLNLLYIGSRPLCPANKHILGLQFHPEEYFNT